MALPPTRESRVYSLLPGCSEATEPTSVQCCWRRRVLRTDVRGLSPGRGLGKRGDGERDSIVNGLGGLWWTKGVLQSKVIREMDPFCRAEYERRNRHLLRRAPLVCAAHFRSEEHTSAGEFFYISKLVSSVIKAEDVAGYGFGRSEAICRRLPPGRPGYYCNFCRFGV